MSKSKSIDPTPEQIALACELIQAGWTREERERRRYKATHLENYRREEMTVQVVDTSATGGVRGEDY